MVWRDNTKLGVGVAKKDIVIDNLNLSCYFFVARYDDNPTSHLLSYKKNVLRGTFNSSICKKLEQFADDAVAKRDEAKTKKSASAEVRSTGKAGNLS